MKGLKMHLYNCENCTLLFGVETAFEEQDIIVCPSCKDDSAIENAGEAEVEIIVVHSDLEKPILIGIDKRKEEP